MIFVSPSQVGSICQLQWRYQRLTYQHRFEGHDDPVPDCPECAGHVAPPRNISASFGTAVHNGIEEYLRIRDSDFDSDPLAEGVRAAHESLDKLVQEGVRWDDPPKLRKDGQPWKNERGKLNTPQVAYDVAERMVRSWVWRFATLPVRDIELKVKVPLDEWGMAGVVLNCRLDVVTLDQGLVDFKTSGEEWAETKWDSKLDQMHLYSLAAAHHYKGEWPEYGCFHVAPRATLGDRWQVVEVEIDPGRLDTVMERVVRPAVRMIQADAFLPNRDSPFPHSEKFCDFWAHCPFGQRGQGAAHTLDVPLTPQLSVAQEGGR